jgi:hypothetical protein
MTATVDDSSPEARDQVLPRLCAVGEGVMRGRDAERQVVRGLLRRAQRVVDEGGSNTIDTFVVGRNGAPGPSDSGLVGDWVVVLGTHGC